MNKKLIFFTLLTISFYTPQSFSSQKTTTKLEVRDLHPNLKVLIFTPTKEMDENDLVEFLAEFILIHCHIICDCPNESIIERFLKRNMPMDEFKALLKNNPKFYAHFNINEEMRNKANRKAEQYKEFIQSQATEALYDAPAAPYEEESNLMQKVFTYSKLK